MRKWILLIVFAHILILPVSALDICAPEVPASGSVYMPEETESFGQGLWKIVKAALEDLQPSLVQGAGVCLSVLTAALLAGLIQSFSHNTKKLVHLVGALMVGVLIVKPANSMLQLGLDTAREMTQYGNLLLPVMTGALAAQGGATASAALYAGTALFSGILSSVISKLLIPMLYIYICLVIADCALDKTPLKDLHGLVKWLMTWVLKIALYVFTGYLGISGVVSGTADAAAVKAAKLTISGFVPVVGGIISDASEAILVSAGTVKSTAGIYGILALICILVGPFLKIGLQYVLLKATGGICAVFGVKSISDLIKNVSGAMGIVLGMIGPR